MERQWRNVELINGDGAEKFCSFLKAKKIKYEPSGCFNYIHFEIYCDKEEEMDINNFLHNLTV